MNCGVTKNTNFTNYEVPRNTDFSNCGVFGDLDFGSCRISKGINSKFWLSKEQILAIAEYQRNRF